MITTGQLRILAVDIIRKITRTDIIQDSDIRYLKTGNGIFPRKMIWYGTEEDLQFKESPYLPSDTFILFDILQEKNIGAEPVGEKIQSLLPFKLIVNIYGEACEDEVQYMLARIHRFDVKAWLQQNKVSLKYEPTEFIVLDGRENATWWKRRRLEIFFNTQQEIEYYDDDNTIDDINSIKRNVRIIKE